MMVSVGELCDGQCGRMGEEVCGECEALFCVDCLDSHDCANPDNLEVA